MTRRIVTAILLTVWTILVVGGLTAYYATRAVLVAELDRTMVIRAMQLAEESAGAAPAEAPATRPLTAGEERYVIIDERNERKVGRIGSSVEWGPGRPVPPPENATFSRLADGRLMRTVMKRHRPAGAGGAVTVTLSAPVEHLDRMLTRLAVTLGVCGLAAGAAAAAVAAWVARVALRPLHAAADAVGAIDERRLDRRIDAASLPPELRPVAGRLNEMLARLEQAFARRRQFLADASHELRTPVAALVTTMEVALRKRRDAGELTRTLESCLGDARHLKRLVHVLMEHARGEASASAHGEKRESLDAAELLGECADMAAALGMAKDVRVERDLSGQMLVVTEPQRLRSVVTNLLSNAVEYNRPGGTVHLSAKLEGGALEVVVRDTGRGIPAEHVPHLFEPFYRADSNARAPAAGGGAEETPHLGLGLFLVESHLKALGGRCTVESEVGVGTTMRVTVPVERPDNRTPPGATSGSATGVALTADTGPAVAQALGVAGAVDAAVENKSRGAAVWERVRNSR
jgi:signal transduction histidine kinase